MEKRPGMPNAAGVSSRLLAVCPGIAAMRFPGAGRPRLRGRSPRRGCFERVNRVLTPGGWNRPQILRDDRSRRTDPRRRDARVRAKNQPDNRRPFTRGSGGTDLLSSRGRKTAAPDNAGGFSARSVKGRGIAGMVRAKRARWRLCCPCRTTRARRRNRTADIPDHKRDQQGERRDARGSVQSRCRGVLHGSRYTARARAVATTSPGRGATA